MSEITSLLVVLISMLQIADVITTENILGKNGKELNPVMDWLFTKFGMHNVLVAKSSLVTLISIALGYTEPLALIPIVLIYFAVVGWNLNQIRKSK